MSMLKDISVVSVYVKDWEGSKKFYSEVLGWPVAYSSDEFGWVEYGDEGKTRFAINRWDDEKPMPAAIGRTIPVFTVEDCHKTTEWLRSRGVKCDDVVHIPEVVTYGTFYDPEGNRLQFASAG